MPGTIRKVSYACVEIPNKSGDLIASYAIAAGADRFAML